MVTRKLAAKVDENKVPVFWVDIDKIKEEAEEVLMRRDVSPPSAPAAAHTSAPTTPVAIDATAVDEAALSLPHQTDSPPSAPDKTMGMTKAPRKKRQTKGEILWSYDLPYTQAISHFCKHGIENQTSKMKVIDCKAVLTLGFGIKATGKLGELLQRVA